jgi:predicted nuclease of predicted toxin-antitoxin system
MPYKLLLISTGNIKNTELESLFFANLDKIAQGFASFDYIEIDRKSVIFHL